VVDLNDTVRHFIDSPEYDDLMARHPGIDVVMDLDANAVLIKGSSVHLTKTLMNVVFNAAEAIVDNGTIHIRTHKERIAPGDLRLKGEPGNYAVLTVVGNGHGIASADLKRVFEPFFTRKVMGRSGTGLGMAIVWAAVEDHKGFIDIDSRIDHGTSVRLFFPATLEKRTYPRPFGEPVQLAGKGEEVLVVDDDLEHREIAMRMLIRLGYKTTAVESGEEAVAKFKERCRPNVVLLDMMLGDGLDGLETYRKILKLHPGQKAIIASSHSESQRVKKAQQLGVGAFIKKPYSLKDIGAAVRYEIDKNA
jgi:CheY-like chemotaxis protein